MSDSNNIEQMLGRIDGKLDQVIDAAREHREDDVRRFSEVYKTLGDHDKVIANARGAKGVIVWLVGGGLVSVGASLVALAKAFGH